MQPTQFRDEAGEPLKASYFTKLQTWGSARLAALIEVAWHDLVAQAPAKALGNGPLLIVVGPEGDRPGTDRVWYQRLPQHLANIGRQSDSQRPFEIRVLHQGRAGLADALDIAQRHLDSQARQAHVLIASVDSLINAPTLAHYQRQRRLISSVERDGFVPGEAAAVLLIGRSQAGRAGLHVRSCARTQEPAHRLQLDLPNQGRALAQAMREAARFGLQDLAQCQFHLSACSGESWYFNEAALAITRALERPVPQFKHHLISDGLGETGAAAGPLMLAYLHGVMSRTDHWGREALVHLSQDDGQCAALMTHWKPTAAKSQ